MILSHLPGGHLPPPNSDISHPPKKTFARRTTATPNFFSFFWRIFLGFSTYSSWRTSRMGRRRCLMRWSWSTSSRRCVTRWSWSTSSRGWLSWWSWRTLRRRKGRLSVMFLLREGLCRGDQGGGCHGCHEGRHVGEGGGGQSHEDGS